VTRRGKIVCTLGPATGTDDMVKSLVEAGMDVARLNFSHGDYADHEAAYWRVRNASEATGRAVGILADLQGPKIRLGRFADGKALWANGETIRITVEECEGTHDRVSTTYKQLASDARSGDRLLVDDGKVALVVEHIDGADVVCTVTEGGPVSNNVQPRVDDHAVPRRAPVRNDLLDAHPEPSRSTAATASLTRLWAMRTAPPARQSQRWAP
jgi:pyruvate kinase